MDEEMIVIEVEEDNDIVDTEIIEKEIEQDETIEYIDVGESKEIEIAIDETIGYAGANDGNYASIDHIHQINQIENLDDTLHNLASAKIYHSTYGGFAEFRKWKSGGYYDSSQELRNTGGDGYFVSLVKNTENTDGDICIDICKKQNDDGSTTILDIYGVTVDNSGFYGYQSKNYDPLNPNSTNLAKDLNYAKVCLIGDVDVRISSEEHDKVRVGDYVVPNVAGYASIYSDNTKKIKHKIGYKVISKGQKQSNGIGWSYVKITLVPQNDNISRVMKELENTKDSINNVIANIDNKVTDIWNNSVNVSDKVDGIEDILEETTTTVISRVEEQLQEAERKTQDIADQAKAEMDAMVSRHSEALNNAKNAYETLYGKDGVLDDISNLQTAMQPLAAYKAEDGAEGAVGFLAQAEKDRTQLATLTSVFGSNGSDIAAIIQKIDENGAAIQHLITHVDKYILGDQSPSNGLTIEQTSFIQPGTIYVPTKNHTETYTYKDGEEEKTIEYEFNLQITDEEGNSLGYGQSYMWAVTENLPYEYMWREYKNVSLSTEKFNGELDGDLWYCWQSVYNGDKILYDSGTLYYWNNDKKIWIPVASMSDNAMSIGSVNQTAKNFQIAYSNMQGNLASLEVKVDEVSTIVQDEVKQQISSINQTAEDITLGVYNPANGGTYLGILLNGMQSTSNYGGRVCIKRVVDSSDIEGDRYAQAPMWDGEKFVFAEGALKEDGDYYPHPDDDTKYCKKTNYGYEVYTIGNEATALLMTKVDENSSEIESWTELKNNINSSITNIEQISTDNAAKIALIAAGEHVICTETNLTPTEADISIFPNERYSSAPSWNRESDGFEFSGEAEENGEYCIIDSDRTCYYRLFFNTEGNISGYEKYELTSAGLASILQKVEENSSSIGMVVENNEVKASIIVDAINDTSGVAIKANKINFDGFTTFTNSSDFDNLKNSVIASVEVQYISWGSPTNTPPENSDEWNVTAPQWEENQYIWQRTVVKYANGATEYGQATCIQGAKGADGTGVAIKGTAYTNVSIDDNKIGEEFMLYNDKNCTSQIVNISDSDAYLVSGYLFVYSGSNNEFTCVGKIQGPSGATPTIAINTDGYWVINGSNTNIKAKGETPTVEINSDGYWVINNTTTTVKAKGDDGVGVSQIINYYMASSRSTGVKSGLSGEIEGKEEWSSDIQTTNANKPYLWNYETVLYTNNTSKSTDAVIIGNYSKDGNSGRGIQSIEEFYCISAQDVCVTPTNDKLNAAGNYNDTATEDTWYKTAPPTNSTHKYLWNCERIKYSDNTSEIFTPAIIGTHSVGISTTTITYGKSDSFSDIPNNWYSSIGELGELGEEQYLWTCTKTDYTDGNFIVSYTYSKQGKTGGIGASVTVESIKYQEGDSPTDEPEGEWSDTIVEVSPGKYLWTKTTFSDGNFAYSVSKQGEQGVSVKEVITLYHLSDSNTKIPQTPIDNPTGWNAAQPTWQKDHYIWICNKTTWTNDTTTYTAPVLANSLNSANENANDAKEWASITQNVLNYLTLVDENNATYINGSTIAAGSVIAHELFTNNIYSTNYKPISGSTFSERGTLLNLEDGSITSKNFAIDNDGNAIFSGRITATSGYIGEDTNGFLIVGPGIIYEVEEDELPEGKYWITRMFGGKYSFTLSEPIFKGDTIFINEDTLKMHTSSGISLDVVREDESPSNATQLVAQYGSASYSLTNNQFSIFGRGDGSPGVYIGMDGIGLGNGNFLVYDDGNLETFGNILMLKEIELKDKDDNYVMDEYTGEPQRFIVDLVAIEDGALKMNSLMWNEHENRGDIVNLVKIESGKLEMNSLKWNEAEQKTEVVNLLTIADGYLSINAYATSEYVDGQITEMNTQITETANAIILEANKYTDNQIVGYTEAMRSEFSVTAEEIAANVVKESVTQLSEDIDKTLEGYATTEALNGYVTTGTLETYATKEYANSQIAAKANEINLSVTSQIETAYTYAYNAAIADTDEKLKSYSTTTDMKAAINTKADSITTTVAGQITEVQNLVKQTDEKFNSYVTKTDIQTMQSDINIQIGSISASVTEIKKSTTTLAENIEAAKDYAKGYVDDQLESYVTTTKMESSISMVSNQIGLLVTKKDKKDVIDSASIIAAINGDSLVTIDADKINLNGITKVSKKLNIGNLDERASKQIQFSDGALIQTYLGSASGGYTALEISASDVKIGSRLDLSGCTEIIWGSNAPSGGGTAYAVFG